ncbi:uncharacterized protein LOC143463033 [Clavelina lepadiformis]|uniref:Uncharacterized protein n=1 Tax=Clavelina lepadiformis TaxID=159417 RepID=A0ABP0FKW9_CLALP
MANFDGGSDNVTALVVATEETDSDDSQSKSGSSDSFLCDYSSNDSSEDDTPGQDAIGWMKLSDEGQSQTLFVYTGNSARSADVLERDESRYWCAECKVGLCVSPRFQVYHTKSAF